MTVSVPLSGDLSGSVQIANVSSQTSGLYRCSATNLMGTENCYVNLSIYSGGHLYFPPYPQSSPCLSSAVGSPCGFPPRSPGPLLGRPAERPADLVHVFAAAGAAAAHDVAPAPHHEPVRLRTGRQEEAEERGGGGRVLQ